MFSFVVEKKGRADHSVTCTYMNIVKEALALTNKEIEFIEKGNHAKTKKSCIVSDTIQVAFTYFCKGYKNQIVWMQGVVPEESFMRNHSKLRYKLISIMERYVLKKAKMLLLVSDEMRKHYETKYKLQLADKSVIMPCFNETEIVNEAFLQEKYAQNNFVYVGSLHAWQCFEQTVLLYSAIEKKATVPTKFYVYTFQKSLAEEIIKKHGVQNYVVDCVEKEKLSDCIMKMKFGFVIREDHTVNNVATPTKFSNYLANGIIPIYSRALRSFRCFDDKAHIGIVYDLSNHQNDLDAIITYLDKEISADELRQKCEMAFDTYYSVEKYKMEILEKVTQLVD